MFVSYVMTYASSVGSLNVKTKPVSLHTTLYADDGIGVASTE